jgi:Uma2 family endonuclease
MELSLDLSKRYTYADFSTWFDGVRRELVSGFIWLMGYPRWEHQAASTSLIYKLESFVRRHSGACKVFHTPFAVRLPINGEEDGKTETVLLPDIVVLCDLSKLSGGGCVGAPDMVIEIQSPRTMRYDVTVKYDLYERHGVREYWVVQPIEHWIRVFTPDVEGHYGDGILYESGSVPVSIFGGELISLSDIFEY